jgi:hypothetical protein
VDLEHPERRDPMSAIGSIGSTVTIEEHAGVMGFWSEYVPAKSKPEVGPYLEEFGNRLGLSVFADSDGHNDPATGKWVAESLNGGDPYKSVDLVVAAGRGGKFEKIAESLGLLPQTPATAVENEGTQMELKDVVDKVDRLTVVVESLVTAQSDGKIVEAQGKADEAAVNLAVDERLGKYDAAVKLIAEAKLTDSQSADLRAKALKGEDITSDLETAKKILAEALALAGKPNGAPEGTGTQQIAEHLGGGDNKVDFDASKLVPGFGQVA